MANKSKFLIAQSLMERISRISNNSLDFEPEFANINHAFILGFRCSKQNTFLGLTQDYRCYNAGLPVVGMVFFKSPPDQTQIDKHVQSIEEYSSSKDGLGIFNTDKDNNLFLICSPKEQNSSEIVINLYDSSTKSFPPEQPVTLVVDESKIYCDSIVAHITLPLKLNIPNESSNLLIKGKLETCIDDIIDSFISNPEKCNIHLDKSNFSNNLSSTITSSTDSLYANLEPSADLLSMGDYLPQMSKKEKEAAIVKWKNKMKNQRTAMEFQLEHQDFSFSSEENLPSNTYGFTLDFYIYLQANNPLHKTLKSISYLVRQYLFLVKQTTTCDLVAQPEKDYLKSCTFKPRSVAHFVPSVYPIPSNNKPDYARLAELRKNLHLSFLVPLNIPLFRYSQRIRNSRLVAQDELDGYLCNVHSSISSSSGIAGGTKSVIEGTYAYHHYMQQRISDNGWGCAYRSLQTIISWFKNLGYIYSPDVELRGLNKSKDDKTSDLRLKLHQESRVPAHDEIQTVLVDVGDKQPSFIGSKQWIGSQEVCYVLDHLYDLGSKFISVSSGSELVYKARDLSNHFSSQSTPVMIGGGLLAHTLIGVEFHEKSGDVSYLVLDPHYTGTEDLSIILKKGWCGWKKNSFWDKNAFYNLCLPQRPIEF